MRVQLKLPACFALALTIGVISSPLRAAEGAIHDGTARWGSISNSDLAVTFAECAYADPPVLLNGSTAKDSEMRQLTDAVTSYMQAMQASLRCLTVKEQDLDDRLSEVQRTTISTLYNNGVDQMNFIAKEYNRQLRSFQMSDRASRSLPEDLRGLGRNP